MCQASLRPKNRRRLKKIMSVAGEARNYDVALKFVARYRVQHAAQLREKMQVHRKQSASALIAELRKWTDRRMSTKWHAALNTDAKEEQTTPELARRALGRIAKDFVKQGQQASSTDASPKEMHQFRIVAKKFRYALELFQPLYESELTPIVASVKGASALLGDINDCVTVAGIVADYKGGHQLADRLAKRQHKKTGEFRKYWKEEFADAERLRSAIDHLHKAEPAVPKKPVASSRAASGQRKSA